MIIGKAITAGGSGGIKCKLNITTSPGAAVTATLGEKVVEAVADESGKAILELSKEGIWTVTSTLDGETVSKEVDTSLSVTANAKFAVPIGELLEGQSIWLKIDGVEKEFIIINQGIPSNSADYDETANGTWVLAKDIYKDIAWGSGTTSSTQKYESSSADTDLVNNILPLFERQDIIQQVNLPVSSYYRSSSNGSFTHSKIARKIFLLSASEYGGKETDSTLFSQYKEGESCNYFTGATEEIKAKRICFYPAITTAAFTYWTRTVYNFTNSTTRAEKYCIQTQGIFARQDMTLAYGIRPALVIKSDTLIDGNGRVV